MSSLRVWAQHPHVIRFVRPSVRAVGWFLVCGLTVSLPSASGAQGWGPADEVHWTITGPGSVTLDWRGQSDLVLFGQIPGRYGRFVRAEVPQPYPFSSAGPFWEAKLTGLAPNTVYHYSVGAGPDHTFRTPPYRGSTGFTVMVMGDIGDSRAYPNVSRVQALVAAERPSFVLMVGDLTYGNSHGQAAVDQHFNDVMVWSQDVAYMPAWGNHEWDSSGDDLRNYKGRFDLPNPQTSPGSPSVSCCGEDWYWFDYGDVRFIAYPEPFSGAWRDWQQKASVLMDQAQQDPAIDYIVTFGHRPAYSSGHHEGSPDLSTRMASLASSHPKYVLNLNGHSHNYERTIPMDGVVHITAGTGGSSLEQDGSCLWAAGCPPPTYTAFRAMHQGVLKLRFTHQRIEGTAICGPAGGGTNDINCAFGSAMDRFMVWSPAYESLGVVPGDLTLTAHVVPNPLPGSGSIDFVSPRAGPALAELFDLDGRRVRVLLEDPGLAAGPHRIMLDGRDQSGEPLQAGVYFFRIRVAAGTTSGRMLLLR